MARRPLALITGASSGIGAATAERLAKDGWRLVLVARSDDRLRMVADHLVSTRSLTPDDLLIEILDAADADAVHAMASRVIASMGVPDAIVNSAGAGAWKRIEETSPEEARTMMDAPFFAAFNVSRAFMPDLLKRGRGVIVHVGSPASYTTWPSSVGYTASRWALRGLHEALCADLDGSGVRSCHVIFGRVDSPYFTTNEYTASRFPTAGRLVRTLKPEECAAVIARTIRNPRRDVAHPGMLRVMMMLDRLVPSVTRRLLIKTGYRPFSGKMPRS